MAPSPYPPIESWRVPEAAVAATLASVVTGGRRGVEAGVFWLGTRDATSTVRAVVHMRGSGVVEAEGLWEVGTEAYGQVSRWARERAFVLLATAHIHGHGVPVRLSGLDRRHLVRAPDLLGIVIGEAGEEREPLRWSWNVCGDDEFRALDTAELARRVSFVNAPLTLARGNAEGVAEWNGHDA